MDVNTAPIQWMLRKFKVSSPSRRGFPAASLIEPVRDIIQHFTYKCYYIKAKNDYRRAASYARRMGNEWNHNEALLVAKVEHYLKECEPY